MRALFIGGTGNVSSACSRLALEQGIDLSLLTRGIGRERVAAGAHTIRGDVRDFVAVSKALAGGVWDVVVDFVAYLPEHVETDLELFRGRVGQYVFISSASVYQKPPASYVVTERTPLCNPFWQYARDKISCEERLWRAWREEGFPATVVRPSLTYGETWIPCAVGGHDFTVAERMKRGVGIIVHGDGQSLWTITHNSDFAKGLIGLMGKPEAVGEAYHITSDEVLTWDRIYQTIADAAGVEPELVHIPSEFIAAFDTRAGGSLLGDKAYSVVFDNSKIKGAVPGFAATVSFAEGIRRSLEWFWAEPARQKVNEEANRVMDRIVAAYRSALP
jgi:nucleoside-diphosphate-sugar epimerase